MSSPHQSDTEKPEPKAFKRKSTEEIEDKLTTPKRKKGTGSSDEATASCVTPSPAQPRTPVVANAGTPKTPASAQRKTVPLSERQQVALLKKIAAEEEESFPKVASPPPTTPSSAVKKTPLERRVNKRNERGETPLHLAAIKGDLKQCKKLIKAGGDVNVKDFAGWSPLHEACNHGWVVVAKQFLKSGADVNAQGLDNDTPLHDAVINGHEKLVKLLLRHGANPRQANIRGKTPLDLATAANNTELLRLLKGDYTASSSDSFSDGQCPTSPESNSSEKHESCLGDLHGVPSPDSGEMSTKGDNFSSIKSSANQKTGGSPRLTLKFHTRERTKTRRNEAGYKSYSVTMETREEGEPYFSPLSSNDSDMGDLNIDLNFPDNDDQMNIDNSTQDPAQQTIDFNSISTGSQNNQESESSRNVSDMDTTPAPEVKTLEPITNTGSAAAPDVNVDVDSVSTTVDETLLEGSIKGPPNSASKNKESPTPPVSAAVQMSTDFPALQTDAQLVSADGEAQTLSDGSEAPKVPPLRIILPPKASSQQSDLPYIAKEGSSVGTSRASSRNSSNASEHNEDGSKKAVANSTDVTGAEGETDKEGATEEKKEEMPRRTLRSHTQAQQQQQKQQQKPQNSSEENSTVNGDTHSNTASNDAPMEEDMNMHPKRRKRLRNEAQQAAPPPVMLPYNHAAPERVVNQLEVFLEIKRQIAQKWQNMYIVQPKPPSGFHEYLMNSANYVLEGNSASRLSVPMLSPPQSVTGPMRDLFMEHEKERYKLRLRHVMERDKLILSFEQENIRIHGRAARAMANQNVPLSVCTILRDLEIYNTMGTEHEEKNSRTRYNGRLLASWRQDLVDKYDKIKEAVLSRQHHEAESLYAVQKMVWECTMKDVGLCDPKTTPKIDSLWVPMVQVSDELDLQS